MTLDIRFTDSAPVQFQRVRMTTLYTQPDEDAKPELILHFYDVIYSQVNIALDRIISVTTTND